MILTAWYLSQKQPKSDEQRSYTANNIGIRTSTTFDSHSLAVEIGSNANITREKRLCRCSAGVQTVWHVFTECHLTRDLVQLEYNSSDELDEFDDENVHNVLLAITKKLKIQIW